MAEDKMDVDTVDASELNDAVTAESSSGVTEQVTEKIEEKIEKKAEEKKEVKKSLGYLFKDAIHDKELKNQVYIRIVTDAIAAQLNLVINDTIFSVRTQRGWSPKHAWNLMATKVLQSIGYSKEELESVDEAKIRAGINILTRYNISGRVLQFLPDLQLNFMEKTDEGKFKVGAFTKCKEEPHFTAEADSIPVAMHSCALKVLYSERIFALFTNWLRSNKKMDCKFIRAEKKKSDGPEENKVFKFYSNNHSSRRNSTVKSNIWKARVEEIEDGKFVAEYFLRTRAVSKEKSSDIVVEKLKRILDGKNINQQLADHQKTQNKANQKQFQNQWPQQGQMNNWNMLPQQQRSPQQQMPPQQQIFQQQQMPHQQQMFPNMMHPAQYAQMYQQQMMRMGMMNQSNGWGQPSWQSSANYSPAAANRGKKRKGNKKKVVSKQPKTDETALPESADKSKEPEQVTAVN